MHLRRSTVSIAILAAAGLSLTACGGSSGDSSSGSGDKIKIGTKFDQPGLGLKEGNKYTGFDVDVATYVAGKMGYKPDQIEWVQAPSKQRETLIKSGQVKLVVASYSITDDRKKEVSFAGPYFIAGQSLLVKADSTINGVKDVKGKKVCSVTGSTSVENLKKEQPDLVPQKFDTYSKCAEALSNGVIDAMTTDDTILAGYANQSAYKGKLKLAGDTFSEENYGIGLKKGDTATCEKVNTAIKDMVKDGTWEKLVKADFGDSYEYNQKTNPPTPATCS
ncbi:glutamate ABC transporter substrate-binding protein [Leekyejoonella antrihumi]|uniref:Glutamate ABC transporter substrate-binding protein n=1 Tax=Leekyejoonella antrihumi TaxID=1660198 RepID=A0A563DUG3_9MICO|nr:glutamate ABC transporter substrate-binding protein [Leekyejoonella antrihumi]TWP33816.1 glutamate ABC transporter substrate-binding protein [Leekyejoonella antrihumi]